MSVVSAGDDRSYSITQAFVDLTVENNGLLHVEEQYDYTFEGQFNGVYRDIPLKSGESIENIEVAAEGAYPVLKESDENGQKHLKIYLYADEGHTKKIRDCDVSIFISYDMKNVVTLFNDVGGLQYKLWGDQWDVPVGSLSVYVTLPGDKNNTYFLNPEDYTASSKLDGNTITATTTTIPKGELYELLVLMPLDDFNNATYNFPVSYDFLRAVAYRNIVPNKNYSSPAEFVGFEYVEDFELGKNERFYPIQNVNSQEILQKYLEEANQLSKVFFVGRLGEFKYYESDELVTRAFETVASLMIKENNYSLQDSADNLESESEPVLENESNENE